MNSASLTGVLRQREGLSSGESQGPDAHLLPGRDQDHPEGQGPREVQRVSGKMKQFISNCTAQIGIFSNNR